MAREHIKGNVQRAPLARVFPIKPTKSIEKFPYAIYHASLKQKVRLRNALQYSGKFKIIQVWADDKICDAHSDSLVLLWRRQWRDMTTQHGQSRAWTGQRMDRAEQSGAEQCWTGIMAQWSDCQLVSRDGQTTRKRTRIPSMAGSKGEGGRRAAQRQAKSKAGRQRPVIVFISRAAPAPLCPFLWLPLAAFEVNRRVMCS